MLLELDGRAGLVQAVGWERRPWPWWQQGLTEEAAQLIQARGWEICGGCFAQLIWTRRNP